MPIVGDTILVNGNIGFVINITDDDRIEYLLEYASRRILDCSIFDTIIIK